MGIPIYIGYTHVLNILRIPEHYVLNVVLYWTCAKFNNI